MGTEIDRLEIQIETQASKANRQLDELISKLGKLAGSLSGINSGGMKQFAAGMNDITSAAKSMSVIKSTEMNRVVNSLHKLGGIKTGNMFNVGSALLSVAKGVQGFSGVSAANIPETVSALLSLSKLGNKGIKNAAATMPVLAKNMQGLASVLNGVNINTDVAVQLSAISSALRTFGHKSMKTAMDNLPALSQGVKELMQTLSTAPKVSANLISLVEALSRLSSVGGNIRTAANAVQSVSQKTSNSAGGLQQLSNSLSRFTFNTNRAEKSTRSLSASISSLYANCFLFIRGFKAIGKAVNSSMDYIETYNYYGVTMSKIAGEFANQWQQYGYESAEAYGDSFATRLNDLTQKMSGYKVGNDGMLSISGGKNLSLDPEQLMSYQSNVAAITNSVGLVGETSVNTAKALSMLAADMSSLKNIDMSTVMTNFQSGLIGQSRALYKYGIDITNATLQTYAYRYGLETAVSEMTQADKMQLRLLAILDQSKIAWGDQASTLNSVANQYRILKQQLANVARVVGNLLIPGLQAVLPVINGILMAFQKLVNFIGNAIFGKKWKNIMDGISGGYGGADDAIGDLMDDTDGVVDSTDGIGDSLDSANDKAKKLQRTLLGFDEINKLTNNSDVSSNTSGGGAKDDSGSGAGGIDLSGAIAAALADYEAVWNKALENSQNKAQAYADNICKAFEKIWKTAEPTRKAISDLWDNGLAKLGKFSGATLYDFWNNFLKPVGTWMLADDAGLPRFFNITNSLLNEIDWNRLRKSLADFYTALQNIAGFTWNAIMDFYEGFLKPVAVWTMSDAIPQLVDIITKFVNAVDWDKLNKSLRELWDALAPFVKNVGQGLINFFEKLMDFGADFLNNVVPGGIKGLADALKKISPEQAEKIGEALGKIALGIAGLKVVSGVIGTIFKIIQMVKGSPIFVAITTLLPAIKNLGKKIFGFGNDAISAFKLIREGATIPEVFSAWFPKISGALTKVVGLFTSMVSTLGGPVTIAIVAAIAGIIAIICNWDKVKEFFTQTLPNWWNQSVVPWIKSLPEFFKELPGKIYEKIIATKDKFVEWASNVWETASAGAKKVIDGVEGFFKELPGKIGYAIGFAIGKVASWAAKLYETIATEIPKIIEKAVAFFKALPGKIWNAIISAKDKFVKWANSIWSVLSQKVPEIITNVFNFFKKLPGKIWDAIVGAVKSIGKWCNDMYQKVIEEVPKIVGKVIDFFKELPGKIYEIGKNLIKGFIKGIKDFFQSGINAVGDFVDGVVRGFKDGFDVHSPSRVMYDIAKNVVAGFGNGINNNWGGVTKNLSNLLSKTKSSISDTLYGIGEMGRNTVNNLVRGFSNIHIPLPHLDISWTRYTIGNRRFSVPDFDINWYAKGGFPETGELFMARERGPELVGKMGNSNVVANNNQITDGIKKAVVEGMMEVAMAMNAGNKEKTAPVIEFTLKTDSETFYRMVKKGKEKYDGRFHVVSEF